MCQTPVREYGLYLYPIFLMSADQEEEKEEYDDEADAADMVRAEPAQVADFVGDANGASHAHADAGMRQAPLSLQQLPQLYPQLHCQCLPHMYPALWAGLSTIMNRATAIMACPPRLGPQPPTFPEILTRQSCLGPHHPLGLGKAPGTTSLLCTQISLLLVCLGRYWKGSGGGAQARFCISARKKARG